MRRKSIASLQNKKAEQVYHDKKADMGCYDTAENYEEISYLFGLDYIHQAQELVLDAGCGTDAFGIRLAKRGYRAIGVDISPKECQFAKTRADREGVDFPVLLADLEKLPFKSQALDNIFCGAVLHHFQNFVSPLQEMLRLLNRGGRIILVEPNGSNPLLVFYFLVSRLLINWFGRKGYLTVNETPHSIRSYRKVLERCGVDDIQIHILKINKSTGTRRFLVALWQRLLPSIFGGMEVVITGVKV